MGRFKQTPRPTVVRTHSSVKPSQAVTLLNRLRTKQCSNGHSNLCSAKKCKTCDVSVLSMTRQAV